MSTRPHRPSPGGQGGPRWLRQASAGQRGRHWRRVQAGKDGHGPRPGGWAFESGGFVKAQKVYIG